MDISLALRARIYFLNKLTYPAEIAFENYASMSEPARVCRLVCAVVA